MVANHRRASEELSQSRDKELNAKFCFLPARWLLLGSCYSLAILPAKPAAAPDDAAADVDEGEEAAATTKLVEAVGWIATKQARPDFPLA